ncbi:hypothetical protein PQ469_24405 [Mucilaginibacter sp. KACC 22773]|uniref:hypothetical protein n=1 Tax=Mucilaginibacter sp. KACC 22773 TaxID=3025671 RepID=UPI0023658AF8|nr:hypothetical protein [Mucilaginibacter sp. KACC 22773]WDF77029.1 hypothetical protein PQ469_24405 [Mucilaginibacter sp. KACC 22773]
MKAIIRNILLTCVISMFCFFGAVGRKHSKAELTVAQAAEARKETLTCLSVAFLAIALCTWRCSVIKRRINQEREYQRRFNDYIRNSIFHRQY